MTGVELLQEVIKQHPEVIASSFWERPISRGSSKGRIT